MHCCCKRAKCQLFLWLAVCAGGLGLLRANTAYAVGGTGFLFGRGARQATPIDTTNLGDLGLIDVDVAHDGLSSLVLAEDGRAFSFGENSNGQLGLTGVTDQFVDVATPIDTTNLGGLKITQV